MATRPVVRVAILDIGWASEAFPGIPRVRAGLRLSPAKTRRRASERKSRLRFQTALFKIILVLTEQISACARTSFDLAVAAATCFWASFVVLMRVSLFLRDNNYVLFWFLEVKSQLLSTIP
jgi:hypothetical protein